MEEICLKSPMIIGSDFFPNSLSVFIHKTHDFVSALSMLLHFLVYFSCKISRSDDQNPFLEECIARDPRIQEPPEKCHQKDQAQAGE